MNLIHIKDMVCPRCVQSVERTFKQIGATSVEVQLGVVQIDHHLSDTQSRKLDQLLEDDGFKRLQNVQEQQIEQLKHIAMRYVDSLSMGSAVKLSQFVKERFNADYQKASRLFSTVVGITLEEYVIRLRIEKAKEWLLFKECTLAEVADELGYASAAYLSKQFKQVTGVTPTTFRISGHPIRIPKNQI
ncbi:MAG: helix-turn-helix domain-containing protein [Flavobacteriales bacterium]|nr:helix-turn-helix domain-containing protein [Bacteroidota bacterium]MCB9241197.1 helix-turn-helix domain-containing protein [Flavobacteriales bacterium]